MSENEAFSRYHSFNIQCCFEEDTRQSHFYQDVGINITVYLVQPTLGKQQQCFYNEGASGEKGCRSLSQEIKIK